MHKWSREEVEQMHNKYLRGGTLRSIGREYGLSYERIRQLFQQHDMVHDSIRMDGVRRYERLVEAWERDEEIVDAYKRLGNAGSVVDQTGLKRTQVDAVLASFDQRATYRNRGGTRKGRVRYTDDTIKEYLRNAASECGQPLTIAAYNRFADGKNYPTNLTIMHRFGSWHAACEAAGVGANQQRARKQVFDRESCIQALQQCSQDDNGVLPSYMRYHKWVNEQDGLLPSAPTIRNRIGSWTEALKEAFPSHY